MANAGGTLRILTGGRTATVSMTDEDGSFAVATVGGSPVTFPTVISSDTTFVATVDGNYTVSSLIGGVETYGRAVQLVGGGVNETIAVSPSRDQTDASFSTLGATFALLPGSSNVGYDVVAILGQSNAVGGSSDTINTTYLDPVDPRIMQFPGSGIYAGSIVGAVDGLFHLYQAATVGPGMPFAREYVKRMPSYRKLLLVPAAEGSTGFTPTSAGNIDGILTTWDPSDITTPKNLYNLALAQIDAALAAAGANAVLTGVIWVQGENDAGQSMSQSAYATKLDLLISGLRTHYANPILPFVIGQMVPSFIAANSSTYQPINAAHIDTPRRKVNTAFAYGTTAAGTVLAGAAIHYSAAGNRLQGASLYDVFNRFAPVNVLGTAPVAPGSITLVQSGTSVAATWTRTPGRVTDHLVEYTVNGGSSWTTLSRAQSIDNTATITGLTLGGTVSVRVSTVNEQGTSTPRVSSPFTLLTLPGQVTGLTAGSASASTQPLTWTAVATAASYLVEYQLHSAGSWATAATVATNAATVSPLAFSTSYDYRVTAINAAGSGTVSATLTASTTALSQPLTDIGVSSNGAYGLRLMASGYAGQCVRVRRSSDSTQQDIGFSGVVLDTAALATFCGAGSGFVVTWYDQSGLGLDLTQATTTAQPTIYSSGTAVTSNGKPAVNFDGSTSHLASTAAGSHSGFTSAAVTMLAVTDNASQVAAQSLYSELATSNTARYWVWVQDAAALTHQPLIRNDAGSTTLVAGARPAFAAGFAQHSYLEGSGAWQYFENGTGLTAGTVTKSGAGTTFTGRDMGGGFYMFTGHVCEFLVFYTALTTPQRQAGELNQKAYWGTP